MDFETVYERLAEGLASLTTGRFDDIPEGQQIAAMQAIDDWYGPDPNWFHWLTERVTALSNGNTVMVPTTNDDFVIKEPGAIYVKLTNGERTRFAVMGRFLPPLQYEPSRPN